MKPTSIFDMPERARAAAKKAMAEKGSMAPARPPEPEPEMEDEPSEEGLSPLNMALESKQPDEVDKTIDKALPPESPRLTQDQVRANLEEMKAQKPTLAEHIDPILEAMSAGGG